MNQLDNFLRNVEARYPSIYTSLHGDRARDEFSNLTSELDRHRTRIEMRYTHVVARVTPLRVVQTEIIGGYDGMEEIPVLIIRG